MGGGSLMTPVMILVMGVKPVIAVGTDLAYGAITKIVGGTSHWRHGNVHRRTAFLLALGSVPATLLGVGLVSRIKNQDPELVDVFLLHTLAWFLILVAVLMVAKPFLSRVAQRSASQAEENWRDRAYGYVDRHPWVL